MLDKDNFLSHILNQTQVLVPESDQEQMLSVKLPALGFIFYSVSNYVFHCCL